jgi:hypothetical protein
MDFVTDVARARTRHTNGVYADRTESLLARTLVGP